MSSLVEKIKTFPSEPGVYQFTDDNGIVLYVGKAKNLRKRIKQYFAKELGRGPLIDQMVEIATDIIPIETESEIEAILLEAELIKSLRPPYNIKLKDDKSFLVIKITKEEFPAVSLERAKNVDFGDKSAEYFGPYPSGELLKRSLRYLRRIFPFRDCSKTKFARQNKLNRACTYGDIHLCAGVCATPLEAEEAKKNIAYLKQFLKREKKQVVKKLEKEMRDLSKAKRFEAAAATRDKLRALAHLNEVAVGLKDEPIGAPILFRRIECYDISNIMGQYAVGSMVVFTNGKPDKDEYRHFRIKNYELRIIGEQKTNAEQMGQETNEDELTTNYQLPTTNPAGDVQMMAQVLKRRFKNDWPKPDLIIVDGGEQQLAAAKKVLKDFGLSIPVIGISKGPRRKKNDFHFSDPNIANYFRGNLTLQRIAVKARNESHRFAISYYRKLHGKGMLEK